MVSLTPERNAQLTALLDELARRPTYDRIVRGVEVIGFNPNVEAEVKQADAVMAASWASYRMHSYLERLRDLNEERQELGTEIRQLREHPYPQSVAEIEAYARARILAPHLSGNQEVVPTSSVSVSNTSTRFSRFLPRLLSMSFQTRMTPFSISSDTSANISSIGTNACLAKSTRRR